jgi:hypothetical protein
LRPDMREARCPGEFAGAARDLLPYARASERSAVRAEQAPQGAPRGGAVRTRRAPEVQA